MIRLKDADLDGEWAPGALWIAPKRPRTTMVSLCRKVSERIRHRPKVLHCWAVACTLVAYPIVQLAFGLRHAGQWVLDTIGGDL